MVDIIEELKKNQILHGKSVAALREYIRLKYPEDSPDTTSAIFADAVNKIIDTNIAHFDNSLHIHIKKNLFKQIAKKEIFTINAYEIFEACTRLDLAEDNYLECLTHWINSNQSETISKDKVLQLALELETSFTNTTLTEDEVALTQEVVSKVTRIGLPPIQLPELPIDAFEPEENMLQKIADTYFEIGKQMLHWLHKHYIKVLVPLLILLGLIISIKTFVPQKMGEQEFAKTPYLLDLTASMNVFLKHSLEAVEIDNHFLNALEYQEVNLEALKLWLNEKNSLLAEEPYFTSIVSAAMAYNVHPLLMFAITGQEQAFVPKSNKRASTIANNPFNVYGSWEDYNTDIEDASKIAAKTVANLRKDCPENVDVIKWINRKYAEDQNWHIGVSKFFAQLEKVAVIEQKK